jgi:hypothetical protein
MSCIDEARARGVTRVEVKHGAHERYMFGMRQRATGTVFKDSSCASSNSYYVDRHGDASLPLPHTPWWRVINGRKLRAQGYRYGSSANGHDVAGDVPRGAA